MQPINWFITRLTGITDAMVASAPEAAQVLKEFYEFAGQDILVGHNVNFDINFLYDNLLKYNGILLSNSFVDTLRLARKLLPNLANHKQITVAEYYGIPTGGSHRALRDCEICNECYLKMKRDFLQGSEAEAQTS